MVRANFELISTNMEQVKENYQFIDIGCSTVHYFIIYVIFKQILTPFLPITLQTAATSMRAFSLSHTSLNHFAQLPLFQRAVRISY